MAADEGRQSRRHRRRPLECIPGVIRRRVWCPACRARVACPSKARLQWQSVGGNAWAGFVAGLSRRIPTRDVMDHHRQGCLAA